MKAKCLAAWLSCAAAAPVFAEDAAFTAGFVVGRATVLTVIALVLVLVFGVLSYRYGAVLRQKRKMGAWLVGGGHAIAVALAFAALAAGPGVHRIAVSVLGIVAVLAGHVGLWMVVLGTRRGTSKLTIDVGVRREEDPMMHALAQGIVILIGLLVLAGAVIFFAIQATSVK